MSLSFPGPVVVLGHTGFIGRPLTAFLRESGASVHGFSSAELNLRDPAAFGVLDSLVGADSTLFVCAALTPDRGATIATCVDHIGMLANLAQYLSQHSLRKCVYVSSDAVYPMLEAPVTEDTPVAPSGAYALAKYTSERLMEMAGAPLLVVRPTGVFGPNDTHNSYGPNRFIRSMLNDHSVRLFGQGEEQRDHLYVQDLVRILVQLGASDTLGILNIATGESRSFGSVVEALQRVSSVPFEVVTAPRSGAVTHRTFDIRRLRVAVPDLQFTPFEAALESTVAAGFSGFAGLSEVNLLDRYPRSNRPIAQREDAVVRERDVAKRFGREYFDGERTQGYGGYRYDGRWVPIAERFRDQYSLKAGDRVLDVGCAKGFLVHDLLSLVPGLYVCGLDVSAYALEHVMPDVQPRCLRATAESLPFAADSFDLVISINTLHNLPEDRCQQALAELERVSRKHKYVQVDSWLTEEQHQNFERWQLTALTYFDPDGWRALFAQAGYTGDYYWTITE